jgi:copper chaperone CopZ
MRISVDGMGCRRCVRKVTARLRDVPGVRTVVADLQGHYIVLTGDMSDHDVKAALETVADLTVLGQVHDSAAGERVLTAALASRAMHREAQTSSQRKRDQP